MTSEHATVRLRPYLLGLMSDDERAATEARYFNDDQLLEALEAAEEELIEDYLAGRLDADERRQFESDYLSTPGHRRRLEVIRRLSQAAAATSSTVVVPFTPRPRWPVYTILAAAAAVMIAIGGALLRDEPATPPASVAQAPPSTLAPSAPAPQLAPAVPVATIFAVTLSPVQVRGAGETPALVIPAGTDVIGLRLEGDAVPRPPDGWHVTVRTVAGDDVWEGNDVPDALPSGVVARVDIPALRLMPEDYTVSLRPAGETGAAPEQARYFLRVRAR